MASELCISSSNWAKPSGAAEEDEDEDEDEDEEDTAISSATATAAPVVAFSVYGDVIEDRGVFTELAVLTTIGVIGADDSNSDSNSDSGSDSALKLSGTGENNCCMDIKN